MIQKGTKLVAADNTGAKKLRCIGIIGSGSRTASIGDIIVVSAIEVIPNGNIKQGTVFKAVVVRTIKEIRRIDGTYVRFSENAVVLINDNGEIKGTRVFGPVTRELQDKFPKIMSLAQEVL